MSGDASEDVSPATYLEDAGARVAQVPNVARRFATFGGVMLLAIAGSAWVLATEHHERVPTGHFSPRELPIWPVTPEGAVEVRNDALRRAQVRLGVPASPVLDLDTLEPPLTCRFISRLPTGTSAKFDCVVEGGQVVKVKYGRNPETAAEVAATRLLSALGFAADRMSIVPSVRCYGCPRYPFFAMRLLQLTGTYAWYPPHGDDEGYSDFTWSAIERKFDAAPIELPDRKGWGWWELDRIDPAVGASRTDVDAMRLMAVFLAHWDNKDENQRLACLDRTGATDMPCARPIAMMQDLGATFGPTKANVARWEALPIWSDRNACTVSMKALPHQGATFSDARISEAARVQIGRQLSALSDAQIRGLFAAARFPEHYSGTSDEEDLAAWHAAFKNRVRQIVEAGPCPDTEIDEFTNLRNDELH
jgi:hypothetical protein